MEEELKLAERLKRLSGEQYEKFIVGVEIHSLRRKSQITQGELAKRLHTSQSVIARIEQGKQNCTIKMLVKIAAVFGKKLRISFS